MKRLMLQRLKQSLIIVSLMAGLGFIAGALTTNRPDRGLLFAIGVGVLAGGHWVWRSYRPSVMVEGDCRRYLGKLGFDTGVSPIHRQGVFVRLYFFGKSSPLFTRWRALSSSRLLSFEISGVYSDPVSLTVRRSDGTQALLPLRDSDLGSTSSLGASQFKLVDEVVRSFDYLDANIVVKPGRLMVEAYGNVFLADELQRNIQNTLTLLDSLQKELSTGNPMQ